MKKLTQTYLKRVLYYDPNTGLFIWNIDVAKNVSKGSIAGCRITSGYIYIKINGTSYGAHRLAFLYKKGYMPEYTIDHKDRIKHHNWWDNLRHATQMCNMQNQVVHKNNTSGFTGVSYNNKNKYSKWQAQIMVNKKRVRLGSWCTKLEAALARLTCELWHSDWNCSYRSELILAIKDEWPLFNPRCLV